MSETLIGPDCVVSIHYVLRDTEGDELDASPGDTPLSYLHGHGQVVPGLENALEGKGKGEAVRVVVEAAEGYGERDPDRMIQVERSQFDFEPSEGSVVRAELPDGQSYPFTIAAVTEDKVVLDGNHPLAGIPLDFEITIVDVRPATAEELAEAGSADAGQPH